MMSSKNSTKCNIELYYDFLLKNPKKANKKILAVYEKLVNDIKNGVQIETINKYTGEKETKEFIFDRKKAERPIYFLETFCRHSKGKWAGQLLKLELFQKALIEAAYGFVDKETGNRKYNKIVFFIAKKNGKSTISSGLGLYGLTSDNEGGAEIYSVAKVKDQAKIVWDEATRMVNKSPQLKKRIRPTISGLYYDKRESKFEALASQKNTLDGKNPFYVLMDEIWAWEDLGLLSMMEDGVSAREQPMIIETSTMGPIRGKVFDHEYDYCARVIKGYLKEEGGIIDETILPIIYEQDSKDEIWDEETWYKSNPALGVSKSFEYLRNKVLKAKNSPIDLVNTLCKDFNVRQTNIASWLTYDELNNEETYSIEEFIDLYVIGGCDLSSTTDLTCATIIGYKNGKIIVKQMYWLPSDRLETKIKEDQIPYDLWEQGGWLRLSEGNKVNYHDVTEWFVEQVQKYGLRPLWVGYDPWSAQYWCDEMKEYGFELVEVRQGAKTMSTPMKEMRADLIAKMIVYNNNPVTKWNLSNLSVKVDDNENIRPVKGDRTQRIDGAVSLIDAYCIYHEHKNEYINYVS